MSLFRPLDYNPLPLLRIALITYLTLASLPRLILVLGWSSEINSNFIHAPWIVRALGLPIQFNPLYVEDFRAIMLGLGFLAVIGCFTRISVLLYGLGYTYLCAIDSSFGWHDHGPSLVCQVLLVLALAPGVDDFSVDRLLKKQAQRKSHPRYGLLLITLLISLFYFNSGFSKIRYGGFAWLNGETLSFYLSGKSLSSDIQQFVTRNDKLEAYLYGARVPDFAIELSKNKILMAFAATSAVLLEILMPLILLGGRLRNFLLIAAAGFHISIYFLMGIPFISWAIIDLALINLRAFKRIAAVDRT